MLPSSDKRFVWFLVRFVVVGAVLYGGILGLVSLLVGGVPWRDALVGAVLGVVCSAIRAGQRARAEAEALAMAMVEAAAFYCSPAMSQDDIAGLRQHVLARARVTVKDVTFHTVDIDRELAPPQA